MTETPASSRQPRALGARATELASDAAEVLLAELRARPTVQDVRTLERCEMLLLPRLESLSRNDQVRVLRACASGCQEAGRWLDGLNYAKLALTRLDEAEEKDRIALLAICGDHFRSVGHAALAAIHYDRALRIARRGGLASDRAGILLSLGSVLADINAPDRALELFNECLSLCDAHGLVRLRPQALNRLATQHIRLGEHERALTLTDEALQICRTTPETDYALPHCWHTRGEALCSAGRHEEALAAFASSQSALVGRPDVALEIRNLIDQGDLLMRLERSNEAVATLERAADLARAHGARRQHAEATLALARARHTLGQAEAALAALGDHLAAQQDVRHLEREGGRHAFESLEQTEAALELARRDAQSVESLTMRLVDTQARASRLAAEIATDPLTGGLNRKALLERLAALCRADGSHPYSVLLIDCDGLRAINAQFGHLGGDQVLRNLSLGVGRILRVSDTFGRYGGDEFMVIAPNAGPGSASTIAERIIKAVASLPVTVGDIQTYATVSIGIACVPAGTPVSVATCVRRAERALARAKSQGAGRYAVARISAQHEEGAEGDERSGDR